MKKQQTAVCIGKFESLHRGHQKLIEKIRLQEMSGMPSVVVTIEQAGRPQILTGAERTYMLKKMGVCESVSLPLSVIRTMTPEEFTEQILVARLHAGYVACGADFHFGHNCTGDAATLAALGKQFGFYVETVPKETIGGRRISSTWAREALQAGDMQMLLGLLGFPYFIEGVVTHGRALGKKLGMPTANILPGADKLLPPRGVYAGETEVDGKRYKSITNIGCKPTVQSGDAPLSAETYLYGFDGDLYGETLRVSLLSYLRPEQKFDSVDALKKQMQADISTCQMESSD